VSRKRIPVWILLIGAAGLTAITLWLALATPTVNGQICRGPWAEVFAEANGEATSQTVCRETAHVRFGISIITGLVALSATTRLLVRVTNRPGT